MNCEWNSLICLPHHMSWQKHCCDHKLVSQTSLGSDVGRDTALSVWCMCEDSWSSECEALWCWWKGESVQSAWTWGNATANTVVFSVWMRDKASFLLTQLAVNVTATPTDSICDQSASFSVGRLCAREATVWISSRELPTCSWERLCCKWWPQNKTFGEYKVTKRVIAVA